MKKKLATFCFALLAIGSIKAQNTALEFDGVDDYANVLINQPPTTFSGESFTFEAIINGMPTGNYATLLSIPQASGNITFGVAPNGQPFFGIGDYRYEAEEANLLDEKCHHMAITILEENIWFYIDGKPLPEIALQSVPAFANPTQMHVGMSYPDQSTAFAGIIDEVRLWPYARTDAEIAQFAFITPDVTQWPRYMLLPFWEATGTASFDPFTIPDNYAYWISSEGADMQ